jgi:uncharacterized membrane protein YebE (DUF533 family)
MTEDKKIKDNNQEKGTSTLLLGAGVGTYGAATLATIGAICPACLVLTPALLGYGAYQRYKFNQNQADSDAQEESISPNHTDPKE